jgi:hypothetical protein
LGEKEKKIPGGWGGRCQVLFSVVLETDRIRPPAASHDRIPFSTLSGLCCVTGAFQFFELYYFWTRETPKRMNKSFSSLKEEKKKGKGKKKRNGQGKTVKVLP